MNDNTYQEVDTTTADIPLVPLEIIDIDEGETESLESLLQFYENKSREEENTEKDDEYAKEQNKYNKEQNNEYNKYIITAGVVAGTGIIGAGLYAYLKN